MLLNHRGVMYIVHERAMWPVHGGLGGWARMATLLRPPAFDPGKSGVRWNLLVSDKAMLPWMVCGIHRLRPERVVGCLTILQGVAETMAFRADDPPDRVVVVVGVPADAHPVLLAFAPMDRPEVVCCLRDDFVNGKIGDQIR